MVLCKKKRSKINSKKNLRNEIFSKIQQFTNFLTFQFGHPNICTHINYAFAFVTDDGRGLRIFEANDFTLYAQIMALKLKNPNLKVILSVGGWTHGTGGFALAAASESSRTTFAYNALTFIKTHQFDGIDIDWEYPGFAGGPKPGKSSDKHNYVPFLQKLKDVFHASSPPLLGLDFE